MLGCRINGTGASLICLTWLGVAALADNSSQLTARQLYYTTKKPSKPKTATTKDTLPNSDKPVESTTPSTSTTGTGGVPVPSREVTVPYLGLRYSILQVDDRDRAEEVDPNKVFRSGDRVQLKLESNDGGYLYVVLQGSMGDWSVLFPSAEIRFGNNLMLSGRPVMIPGEEFGDFKFDKDPGTEKLFVVLSRQPEKNLEQLVQTIQRDKAVPLEVTATADPKSKSSIAATISPSAPATELARYRKQLESRGMTLARRQKTAQENRVIYVVDAGETGKQGRVVTDIFLKHQ